VLVEGRVISLGAVFAGHEVTGFAFSISPAPGESEVMRIGRPVAAGRSSPGVATTNVNAMAQGPPNPPPAPPHPGLRSLTQKNTCAAPPSFPPARPAPPAG